MNQTTETPKQKEFWNNVEELTADLNNDEMYELIEELAEGLNRENWEKLKKLSTEICAEPRQSIFD